MKKIDEGVRNRVFELNFDHGKEFIAKIPFPSARPKHYCTASEVATLNYLQTCHGIPVPTVRTWCPRAESSPIGTEYVMYEKLQGVRIPLFQHDQAKLDSSVWEDPYIKGILAIVQRVETRLATIPFA